MTEDLKAKTSNYVVGAIAGAILTLIAGFWFGPLTTNGALAGAVDDAVVQQQALFCAERGRSDPGFADGDTFKALAFAEKRDFAGRFSTFDGQSASLGRAVTTACRNNLEATS